MEPDTFLAEIRAKETAMNTKDQKAKADGTLVGRYIQEEIADGYAHYEITAVVDQTVFVKHLDICDGWTIPFVEAMDREIPLKYVTRNVELRDQFREIFGTSAI